MYIGYRGNVVALQEIVRSLMRVLDEVKEWPEIDRFHRIDIYSTQITHTHTNTYTKIMAIICIEYLRVNQL